MEYPTSFQTTDAVIVNPQNNQLLLGKRATQDRWRFIGGFVDPDKDQTLEGASKRERIEEAGINLECAEPRYLFSFRVDDPRYRESKHKIMTAAFLHEYVFGFPTAGDDIAQVAWFADYLVRANYKEFIVQEHWPIVEKLISLHIL